MAERRTPADDEAAYFVQQLDTALMRVPHAGDGAYGDRDFRNARTQQNHIVALRRVLLRAHQVLTEWEVKAREGGVVGALPADDLTIAARVGHARDALRAHDRASGAADSGNATALVAGLLHVLTWEHDSPVEVLSDAIELYVGNQAEEDDRPWDTTASHYKKVAAPLIAWLLDSAERMTGQDSLGLLHIALGHTQS